VLALADRLGLTAEQKARTEAVFTRMEADARDLGRVLVERETTLDRLFASRRITREQLAATLEEIGRLQGQLRKVHLEAHLAQTEILTPEQISRYDELRGYGAAAGHDPAAHKRGLADSRRSSACSRSRLSRCREGRWPRRRSTSSPTSSWS
jgi:Spy/CpxP family protein refolding chaperone